MSKFLMIWNSEFQVSYKINHWMIGQAGLVDTAKARKQWEVLKFIIEELGSTVVDYYVDDASIPDIVFTANAGMTFKNTFIPSNFAHSERQNERPLFEEYMKGLSYDIDSSLGDEHFEGEGDALFDDARGILWLGYGFRTTPRIVDTIKSLVKPYTVIPINLINPYFYHLDTCCCPLTNGCLGYMLSTDIEGCDDLTHVYGKNMKWVSTIDADNFACNSIEVDDCVITNFATSELKIDLAEMGYLTIETPLTEFMKSGGSAKCLTLRVLK